MSRIRSRRVSVGTVGAAAIVLDVHAPALFADVLIAFDAINME
jgi:hypothetical protein